jgi:hypothetical protein
VYYTADMWDMPGSLGLRVMGNVAVKHWFLKQCLNCCGCLSVPATCVANRLLMIICFYYVFLIFIFVSLNFQYNTLICFFFKSAFIFFILSEIIYEIIILFSIFCHIWFAFFKLLFVLFEIVFKINLLLWFYPFTFFFLSDLIVILFIVNFFYFRNFFKLMFFFQFHISILKWWGIEFF